MDFSKARPFPRDAATVEGCYSYLDCDVLIIDKYLPSRLDYSNLAIAQDELPGGGTVVFFDSMYDGTLALRVPNDPSLKINITINGDEYYHVLHGTGDQPRHALVSGPFEVGCRVKLEIGAGSVPKAEPVEKPEVEADSVSAIESATEDDATPETEDIVITAPIPSPIPVNTPAAAHDPALQLKSLRTDNGDIFYNDSRSRFFVELERFAKEVTLSLPEGYDFEVNDKCSGNTHVFRVNDTAFTGYEFRVYTDGHKSYRDFDLAIMQVPKGDAAGGCSVHAYTPIIGAFSGETCYIIDRTSPEVKAGTHGTTACKDIGIDPATGYKWGSMGNGTYYFDLENGGYEVVAAFTGTGARMIANPGTPSEKVLVRESSIEEQRYGVRVTDGQLVLSIVSDGDSAEETDITTLVIRAIDTIAIESGYTALRPRPKKETPVRTTVRPEVQTHINSKLATKKTNSAAKALGIATGAVAVTAGIISLLSRDRK